jgi:hypothetical protein
LAFVLADDEARGLAAVRPSTLRRVRGRTVALGSDFTKSAWAELMRVGDRRYDDVRPRVTDGVPRWKGSATMSLDDARAAAAADQRAADDTVASSLGGDEMPVSGKLEIFDDHLVMNVPDSGPLDSFALRPLGAVRVVAGVDGTRADVTFVLTVANGRRVLVRLGRARGLADVLGTLPPA